MDKPITKARVAVARIFSGMGKGKNKDSLNAASQESLQKSWRQLRKQESA